MKIWVQSLHECNLGHDVLVVVVSQCSAEFVVVHVRLALSFTPTSGNLVRINQLELAVCTFPTDAVDVAAVRQQLQQKLPQLNLTASCSISTTTDYTVKGFAEYCII